MSREIQAATPNEADVERRLSVFAKRFAHLEMMNHLLSSLCAMTGLDNMVLRTFDILMQTVEPVNNISIIYRLDETWQYQGIRGTKSKFHESDHPEVVSVLASGNPLKPRGASTCCRRVGKSACSA